MLPEDAHTFERLKETRIRLRIKDQCPKALEKQQQQTNALGTFSSLCVITMYDPATSLPGIHLRKLMAFVHIKPWVPSSVSNWKPLKYPPMINEKQNKTKIVEKNTM